MIRLLASLLAYMHMCLCLKRMMCARNLRIDLGVDMQAGREMSYKDM